MKLYDKIGEKVAVYKATRWPKIGGKNAIWYEADIEIDYEKVTVHWECARGQRYYFQYKGNKYYMPFYIDINGFPEDNINIDWETETNLVTMNNA